MREYMTLLGAEDVVRGGNTISEAADTMRDAASSVEDTMQRFLERFENLVLRMEEAAGTVTPTSEPKVPCTDTCPCGYCTIGGPT